MHGGWRGTGRGLSLDLHQNELQDNLFSMMTETSELSPETYCRAVDCVFACTARVHASYQILSYQKNRNGDVIRLLGRTLTEPLERVLALKIILLSDSTTGP